MSEEKKRLLLDDSSDSETDFQINKGYADNYAKWRHKEELQKLKDKYGDEDSTSSSESEDDDPIIEKDFLKTLSFLKSKDPQIYDENVTFFKSLEGEKKSREKKQKVITLKDQERMFILEKNGKLSDDEDDILHKKVNPTLSCSNNEKLEEIKKGFKLDSMSTDQSMQNTEDDESDCILWLKGETQDHENAGISKDLKSLHDHWNDPNLDSGERFLKDYILNKRYARHDDLDSDGFDGDCGTLSDDENLLEKQETFEHKYNFRFEEPDAEFIKRYPRTVGDSLRKTDNKRRLQRDDYQERKRQEKEQKMEEIKRLKALKRKEIENKISELKSIAGCDDFGFNEQDMEQDFDPDEHDKKMNEMFNNDYYGVEEVNKPEFPPDEEFECENWDNWNGANDVSEGADDNDVYCDDPEDLNMDADYDPKMEFQKQMRESTKPKKKRKSQFASALSCKKPSFDPGERSFGEYYDEYYKLDCEDFIGDLPVRFKYRKVVPNNFGLSTEEILSAKDKELNQWCSVKKMSQFRKEEEELYDVQAFKKKSENKFAKEKILSSLYGEMAKDMKVSEDMSSPQKNKKRKRKNDSLNQSSISESDEKKNEYVQEGKTGIESCSKDVSEVTEELNEGVQNVMQEVGGKTKRKRKRKNKQKANIHQEGGHNLMVQPPSEKELANKKKVNNNDSKFRANTQKLQLPDARLKAYGINPKKFKNHLKYSKKDV